MPNSAKKNKRSWHLTMLASASLIVVSLAGLTLVGWGFDIPVLRNFGQPVPMNPMVAVSFISTAAALWLLRDGHGLVWSTRFGRLLGLFVAAMGFLKLAEYWFGWHCATDLLLFRSRLNGNEMAPNTALCLLMVGSGLFLLDFKIRRNYRLAPWLFLGAITIALLALAGYVYTVLWLYSLSHFIPMALNTAIAFITLSVGCLCVRPDAQPVRMFLRDWTLEKKVRVGFAIALTTLVLIAFTSYRSATIAMNSHSHAALVAPDEWHQAAIDSARRMIWTTGLGSGLAFVLVATAGWLIRRDISDRKKLELDLLQAKEMAETASRTKSEFLAHMSHEIRTPLNGVIGMIDLLLGLELTGTQRHYAELVKSSGESLATLLNDILDFSKIEAGKLEIERIEFDLLSAVEDIAEVMTYKASQKGLEIACHCHSGVPRLVHGDPERVRQILVNLVNNAIKFTESGSVSIRMNPHCTVDDGTTVRFAVTDTGIGIPPERLGRLFKSFSQVDASTTRKYGGTGLGLAISKQLAELMGGEIGVESEVGKGSTFWFTIKFATGCAAAIPASRQPGDVHGLRVLAVDDNLGSREALRQQIASWGLEAATAAGGKDALRALGEAAASGKAYRVTLVDDEMPDMSGIDLARAIRADAALQETALMILLSAQTHVDPAYLRAAGFVGHMTKPVRQSQLFDAIMDAIATTAQPASENKLAPENSAPDDSPPLPVSQSARILLAEDNGVNQIVASEILRKYGYTFEVVDDGRKAIEAALSGRFDLVLMDCQMPQTDGFEATLEIRRHEADKTRPSGRRLPIVALTANAIKGDRERCLEAGMDAYVSKPIKPKLLIEAIQSLLPKTSDPCPVEPMETPNPSGKEDSVSPTAVRLDSPPFSVNALIELCMGNVAAAASVLNEFGQEIVADLEKVQTSAAGNDCKNTAMVAHALKGAAGMLQADDLQRIAADLERLSRANDLGNASHSLEALREEVHLCLDYLPAAKSILSEKAKALTGGYI